jgi:PiT family inorganic phosphate transporter
VIFGALVGAMTWNVITWWRGIPSSSSHALIGGLLGSGVMHAGTGAIVWKGVTSTTSAIVLSPVVGLVVSMLLMLLSSWAFAKASARTAESTFKKLHLLSAAAYSIGHGANDAQKTMGIIAVLLYSQGMLGGTFHVPGWVVLSCYVAMGLGTLSGGWKIIETMGSRITKLSHHQGFCASAGGSIMLFAASAFGIPVSTTHTITGCVVGVGAARRASAVRWSVAQRVVVAWLVTIPASAFVGAVFYEVAKIF